MSTSSKNRIKSTIIVDANIWKEVRIEAIRRDMEIGQLVEEALREKLTRGLDERRIKLEKKATKSTPAYVSTVGREHHHSQSQSQSHPQQTIQQLSMFNHDNVVPTLEKDQYEVVLWMPGLTFPTSKDKVIHYAKMRDQSDAYKFESKLAPTIYQILSNTNSKKIFGNVSVLEDEIIEHFKTEEGIGEFGEFREEKRFQLIKDCKIIVNEDKNEYLNYLSSLHERMKAQRETLGKDSDNLLHQNKKLSELLSRLNVK